MSTLIATCPRCKAQNTTFDVLAENYLGESHGWQMRFEAFCICRHCTTGSVFRLETKSADVSDNLRQSNLSELSLSLNNILNLTGHLSIADFAAVGPPDHLPDHIEQAFAEGARCLAVDCPSAAGVMFRRCVDLMIKDKHPNVRGSLKAKLDKLFDDGLINQGLKDLADCIREDGNDGAHNDPLSKADAEDLLEFADRLLTQVYTEPRKLEVARERRDRRRAAANAP